MFSKYFILIFSACLLSAVALSAQRLVYDVQYEYYFDNREFDRGGNIYTESMTINASRLTSIVGFSVNSGKRTNHKLIFGAQNIRNMGESPSGKQYVFSKEEANPELSTKRSLQEFVYYYDFRSKLSKKSTMEGVFGAFPRSKIDGEYSSATLSDSLRFYDPTIEGMLLKYKTGSFFAELGLDWMGMAGFDRKERFEIFSYGKFDFSNTLSAGWTLNLYHFAGSVASPGVVDNVLLSPHLKFDFSKTSSFQRLSFKFSALTAYQWDRRYDERRHIFLNGEFITDIRKYNLGIYNTLIRRRRSYALLQFKVQGFRRKRRSMAEICKPALQRRELLPPSRFLQQIGIILATTFSQIHRPAPVFRFSFCRQARIHRLPTETFRYFHIE